MAMTSMSLATARGMKMKKENVRAAACLVMMLLSALPLGVARADCTLSSGIKVYSVVQARDGDVDSSLPAGTSLGAPGQYTQPSPWSFNCAGASSPVYLYARYSAPNTANDTYELTVGGQPAGVGLRLSVSNDNGPFQSLPLTESRSLAAGTFSRAETVRAELVRTAGPVVYGIVDQRQIGGGDLYNGVGPVGSPIPYSRYNTGNISLVRPACSIAAGDLNQTVSLGNHSISELQQSNATAWVPFHFTMANCTDAGVSLDITFGTASDMDSSNSRLFSMRAGSPTGIGIAVAQDNADKTPVLPGVIATYPAVSTGQVYNFVARIERNGSPLSAGVINRPVVVLINFR